MRISLLFKHLRKLGCGAALGIVLLSDSANADEILIAVASNFVEPMTEIIARFEQETGHTVEMAVGSSGRIYAQIVNGAPFQIFFSADQEKIEQLESDGLVIQGSRFTYAKGRLALWSSHSELALTELEGLKSANIRRLAIANPRVAPYGIAAMETLASLDAVDVWQSRIVQGENIAQTYQFVETGNADMGFVALSQVFRNGNFISGRGLLVPGELHQPIRQDVAQLIGAESCIACAHFLDFIKSEESMRLISGFGYQSANP